MNHKTHPPHWAKYTHVALGFTSPLLLLLRELRVQSVHLACDPRQQQSQRAESQNQPIHD